MRGVTPLLERWLGNLLSRQFEGRHSKGNIFLETYIGKHRNFFSEKASKICSYLPLVLTLLSKFQIEKKITPHFFSLLRKAEKYAGIVLNSI